MNLKTYREIKKTAYIEIAYEKHGETGFINYKPCPENPKSHTDNGN